jgi:hypothetical protein
MKTTWHTESVCPFCGQRLDASAAVSDPESVPSAGDLTVCIMCASPLAYDAGLKLRALSPAEVATLPADVQAHLRLAQRTVRSLDRRRVS